jgi:hypothetical protein
MTVQFPLFLEPQPQRQERLRWQEVCTSAGRHRTIWVLPLAEPVRIHPATTRTGCKISNYIHALYKSSINGWQLCSLSINSQHSWHSNFITLFTKAYPWILFNPVRITGFCFCKNHFLILPCTSRWTNWYIPFRFSYHNFVCILHLPVRVTLLLIAFLLISAT